MDSYLIHGIASRFRQAIKDSGRKPEFPVGCCKLASIMLVRLFIEEHGMPGPEVNIIKATNGEKNISRDITHFLARVNNYYVDITADQYNRPPFYRDMPNIIVSDKWYLGSFLPGPGTSIPVASFDRNGLGLAGPHLEDYLYFLHLYREL